MSKIHITLIHNARDFDIVMLMYNWLEYSNNYSMISGSVWSYYRDEVNDAANEYFANYRKINKTATANKSFEYKTKIIGSTSVNTNRIDAEFVVPLKFLSNFWRSFD